MSYNFFSIPWIYETSFEEFQAIIDKLTAIITKLATFCCLVKEGFIIGQNELVR